MNTLVSPDARQQQRLEKQKRNRWLRQLHQWHWISSAICLIAMLLFAMTGITLNHASSISSTPKITQKTTPIPASIMLLLPLQKENVFPPELKTWLEQEFSISISKSALATLDNQPEQLYLGLPRAGGDGWIVLDYENKTAEFELTQRGWIAYINDLHKGRNTGEAWRWFIDIFAVACVIFCITGVLLLKLHAKQRSMTWPVVSLGFILPVLILIIFAH